MTTPSRRDLARASRSSWVNPATIIVVCALSLTLLGLAILFSASAAMKQNAYFYLQKQVIGVVVAVIFGAVVSRVDLDYLRRYAGWIAGIFLVLLALVLVEDPSRRTMAGALGAFQGHYATDIPLLCAGTILILLPTLVVYLFLQRHIVAALLQGSVKG